jgi:hypothetical protein
MDMIRKERSVRTHHIPTYRRPLNNQQAFTLYLLYRFRFATNEQLTRYRHQSNTALTYSRLRILAEQGLIDKRYDKTYKLRGRPAAYYLTPKGARSLKSTAYASRMHDRAIKAFYKNKTVSETYIDHSLNIVETCIKLQELYGDAVGGAFTRTELLPHPIFPKWKPDILLRLKHETGDVHFFLDVFDDTQPFFVHVRKVRSYIEYASGGEWPTNTAFPPLLAICSDTHAERKLRRQIRKALYESWENILYATTTRETFNHASAEEHVIWMKSDEEEPSAILDLPLRDV